MRNLNILFVIPFCLVLQAGIASAETTFVPFDMGKQALVEGEMVECTSAGEAVVSVVMWGAEADELHKALARENGLEEKNFDSHYGPFTSYRDYSLGIEAHRELYLRLLRQKGFSAANLLDKNADGTIDLKQDPQAYISRLTESLEKYILEIGREKGWATITASMAGGGVEPKSPRCQGSR